MEKQVKLKNWLNGKISCTERQLNGKIVKWKKWLNRKIG